MIVNEEFVYLEKTGSAMKTRWVYFYSLEVKQSSDNEVFVLEVKRKAPSSAKH